MIERDLRRLQAKQPKRGDVLPRDSRPSLALSQTERTPSTDVDFQRTQNEVFKGSGSPTLGQAHDFGWMPQRALEIRNSVHTVIDLGGRGGAVTIDVDHAQIYVMQPTAPVTLIFDTSEILDPYDRSGINVDFLVLIENDPGHAITIAVDHWAPFDAVPSLNRAGFYEILISIAVLPTRQISRAYPCIQPPVTP